MVTTFVRDVLREATTGSRAYHAWMAALTLLMCAGAWAYSVQLAEGLAVTGMHDSVSWGLYISNFAFLVGVAAAAVILVLPTYILHDVDFARAVPSAKRWRWPRSRWRSRLWWWTSADRPASGTCCR